MVLIILLSGTKNIMENKISLIAEIGWNHMGNMQLAEKMIKSAKKSGADYCKFQTWKVKNLVKGSWDQDGRKQIYEKAELNDEKHFILKKICKKNDIGFFTSVFNKNDLPFLKKLNKSIIKIPSHEIYNINLISDCLKNFNKVLISIGASNWSEVKKITKLRNFKKKAILMHCISSYPCNSNNLNFKKFDYIKSLSPNFGYSGHYSGIEDALVAISHGASFIEKHFTINKKLPGRDNKFAILPDDLKMISNFKNFYVSGRKFKGLNVQKCERDIYKNYRGRWSGK
jgi:sialic acid synthase SpsE